MTAKRVGMVFAIAAACGGGGGGNAGPPLTVDQLIHDAVSSECTLEFKCCSTSDIMLLFGSFTVNGQPITTEAQCEQLDDGFVGLVEPAIQASISSGRVLYNGSAAASCIAAVRADTACDDLFSSSSSNTGITGIGGAACGDVFTPTVAAGAAASRTSSASRATALRRDQRPQRQLEPRDVRRRARRR